MGSNGNRTALGSEQSKALWESLKTQKYIDAKGRIQDSLKKALKENSLSIPQLHIDQLKQVADILEGIASDDPDL